MTKNKPIKIGNCKYGWRVKGREWIENEGEQRIISRVEELRSMGVSYRRIKEYLEEKGYGRRERKDD